MQDALAKSRDAVAKLATRYSRSFDRNSIKSFLGNNNNDYNKKGNMQMKSNRYLTNSIECESGNLRTGDVNECELSSTNLVEL